MIYMPNSEIQILIVDDDRHFRTLTAAFLNDAGYSVIEAYDGIQALDMFRKYKPPVVLLDVYLPLLDGLSVLSEIAVESPETVTIMISADHRQKNIIEALRFGAWDYIYKPVEDLNLIQLTIETSLERVFTIKKLKNSQKYLENALLDLKNENEQRKAAQDELMKVNEELARSENDLKRANAEKDKFFSILAHDLNNPLNTLMLNAEMLVEYHEKMQKEKLIEKIKTVYKSSKFLVGLISNLQKWAVSQSGRLKYSPSNFDLYAVVKENIGLLEASLVKKNLKLIFEIEKFTYVYADKNMISTVIRNLLSNAIKFTDKNGEISVYNEIRQNAVRIYIKDTGMGISSDDMAKIFRLDVNNREIGSSQEKGSGLGLILCKEFVEKNGGNIYCSSKLGEGTTFHFSLPKANI